MDLADCLALNHELKSKTYTKDSNISPPYLASFSSLPGQLDLVQPRDQVGGGGDRDDQDLLPGSQIMPPGEEGGCKHGCLHPDEQGKAEVE